MFENTVGLLRTEGKEENQRSSGKKILLLFGCFLPFLFSFFLCFCIRFISYTRILLYL